MNAHDHMPVVGDVRELRIETFVLSFAVEQAANLRTSSAQVTTEWRESFDLRLIVRSCDPIRCIHAE
jgi:hypothetical protein